MRLITPLLFAALAVALVVAGSAEAQAPGGGLGGGRKRQQTTEKAAEQKPKADDKAYKNALKGLPDKPYDPWHGAR